MAGDWIKIETVTPDKPEIDALAELLGASVNEVLGALVRLWIWADQQTVDGNAHSVTESAIDRHSGVTGFADALLSPSVAWMLRGENGGFVFPNFDRHNGQTAKNRALTAKRVRECRQRKGNAKVTPDALPREEKRREEIKEANASGNSPSARPTPQEFFDRWNVFAKGKGLTVARVLNDERRRKIKTRLGREGWWEAFTAAVKKLPVPNDEKFAWQPDLDWFIANDTNAAKVAEGRYDKPSPPGCESMDFSDVPTKTDKPKLPF